MKVIIVAAAFVFLFSAGCEQEISTSPPEILKPNTGMLFIDSKPDSFEIFFNNIQTGYFTPDTVKYWPEGMYKLTLKRRFWRDSITTINIEAGTLATHFFDFTQNPAMRGKLDCYTIPPGASIILDDSVTGRATPWIFENLMPGMHKLQYKLYNHRDGFTTAYIYSGITNAAPDVFLVDTSIWVHFNTKNAEIPFDYLTDIAIEKGYIKWFGTYNAGLVMYDDNEWITYTTNNSGLPDNFVNCIFIDSKNKKWIGTLGGFASFDGLNWEVFNTDNSPLPDDNVTAIYEDIKNNELWIGTHRKGLVRISGNSWTIYDTSNSHLPSNYIQTIYIDKSGNRWIGSSFLGLSLDSRLSKFNIDRYDTSWITAYTVRAIEEDKNMTIWFAAGDIFPTEGKYGSVSDSLIILKSPLNSLSDMTIDANNNFWFISFTEGMAKYLEGTWEFLKHSSKGLRTNALRSIAIDGQGHKWITSFGEGLIKYKGN
jgi:hypothetical protein